MDQERENIFAFIEDQSNETILDRISTTSFHLSPTTEEEQVDDQVPPLSFAIIKQKDDDVVEAVLDIAVNEPSLSQNNYPLHYAVMYPDNKPLIRLLLKRGADPRNRNADGKTAIDVAAEKGYYENIKAILKYCKEEECPDPTELENSLQFISSNNGDAEKTREILEKQIIKLQEQQQGGGLRKTKKRKRKGKQRKSKKNGKRFNCSRGKIR
jgi:ankyrin repeat protein